MQEADYQARRRKMRYYRWIIWAILLVLFLLAHFHRMALGVIKEELVADFALSNIAFANIGSVYFYIYMIMQIPSGLLADSLGARKTVAIATVLAGAGSIIFGSAESVGGLITGRFLIGMGVSVVFIAILKFLSQWFNEEEFGTLSSITSSAGLFGGILAQGPLVFLVAWLTWQMTFMVIGVFYLVMAALVYTLVRNTPAEMGLPSPAGNEDSPENAGREADQKDAGQKPEKVALLKGLLMVLKNARTWAAFFVFCGFYGSYIALTGIWGTTYITDVYGLTRISAANLITYAIAGTVIGAAIIGKISDYIRKRKLPMLVFGGINIISWFALIFLNGGKLPLGVIPVVMFLIGFSSVPYSLSWACSKEINPNEIAGISTSVVNVGGHIGGASVSLLMGVVFDYYGAALGSAALYQKAFLCCLGSSLLGFVMIFLIKETNCRNIYCGTKLEA